MISFQERSRLGRFLFPCYTYEKLADDGNPPFWLGIAWVDYCNRGTTYAPRPLNILYRLSRRLFEYLYWPIRRSRQLTLIYAILRRSIRYAYDGEVKYTHTQMVGLLNEIERARAFSWGTKKLEAVHEEWVGYK